jgi:hypothetical protein
MNALKGISLGVILGALVWTIIIGIYLTGYHHGKRQCPQLQTTQHETQHQKGTSHGK